MTRVSSLWMAALIVMLAAAAWQRRSGPSYPYRAKVPLGNAALAVSLPRSHSTTSGARVAVPAPGAGASGTLHWRCFRSDGPFAAIPLRPEGGELAGALPDFPPAGKVEYYVELTDGAEPVRVPTKAGETVILRYHDPVPVALLLPHIAVMFLAMLIGVRAGLAAALDRPEQRALAVITLAGLTLGGLILGPIAQKVAFGDYWTGVPFGWDLTDNKTALMWIGWAAAGVALARHRREARWLVVSATLLMLTVYVVPHSVRGSARDCVRPAGASRIPQAAGISASAGTVWPGGSTPPR